MKIHVVKSGESLREISGKYTVTEQSLRLANQLPFSGPLSPGQSILIPGDMPQAGRSLEIAAFFSSPAESGAARLLTYFSCYSHSFDELGSLIPPDFEPDIETLRSEGCAPLLCLANLNRQGGFSPELAHLLFSSAQLRDRLFENIVSQLKAQKYYGLQLCFNYLFPFDRDNYSAFAGELSALLHREGFLLFIELAPPDSPALSSGFDYAALGTFADRLSLMFCRWAHAFSPPQALAPLNFLRDGLDYLSAIIPGNKMLLGISGCGFDWRLPWRQGDGAQQLPNALAAELAMSQRAEIKFDARAQAPYFDYRDPLARRHRVYFEDARSLDAKLRLLEEYSLAGLSLYSFDKSLRSCIAVWESLYCAEKLL